MPGSSDSRLVVLNPAAGSARRALMQVRAEIADSEALAGARVEVCEGWEEGRRATRDAVESGCSLVVAAGGDGTVNSVVTGLMEGDPPRPEMAVLPLGTGNDFARSLGLAADLRAGLEVASAGPVREVDVLRVSLDGEKRCCVNVSAGGFSGQVDDSLSDDVKETWGPLAYLLKAIEKMADVASYESRFEWEGGEVLRMSATNVVIANGRFAAGGIPVAPEAILDDGLIDVVILEAAPVRNLAVVAARMAAGRHLGHPLVRTARTRSLRVESDPGMTFNVDGEVIGSGVVEVEVEPAALRVRVGSEGGRAFDDTDAGA